MTNDCTVFQVFSNNSKNNLLHNFNRHWSEQLSSDDYRSSSSDSRGITIPENNGKDSSDVNAINIFMQTPNTQWTFAPFL